MISPAARQTTERNSSRSSTLEPTEDMRVDSATDTSVAVVPEAAVPPRLASWEPRMRSVSSTNMEASYSAGSMATGFTC